jgi:hypothetical protein
MDGKSVRSCLLLAVQARNHNLQTVEGMAPSESELHTIQNAFSEKHGLQCGFCTTGFLMTVSELLDKRSEFQAAFHWHVLDKGIGHVYIKPMRPRLNGKVERSHRIDAEEFYRLLNGVVIDDANVFNEKLQEWEHFYNYARPHGALGGQTPYERLRQKTTLDVSHPRQSHTLGWGRLDSNQRPTDYESAALTN